VNELAKVRVSVKSAEQGQGMKRVREREREETVGGSATIACRVKVALFPLNVIECDSTERVECANKSSLFATVQKWSTLSRQFQLGRLVLQTGSASLNNTLNVVQGEK
jgi:hypothetical protein